MKLRALAIVVMVAGYSLSVWGQGIQDTVFYDGFESGDTSGWWVPARVGRTGQTTCYDGAGTVIPCAGTGQDGDILPGVGWPNPRFVDNTDGTVTDMLTGLVWLKDSSCADIGSVGHGEVDWPTALSAAAGLADGDCGLTDGSVAGDWRLPSLNELHSLADYEYRTYALSDASGTAQWSEGDPFEDLKADGYWSSTSIPIIPSSAWIFDFGLGNASNGEKISLLLYFAWPVRSEQGWAPARVGRTGQTTCYDGVGTVIPCAGTGHDGDILPGVEWPNPRFVDNTDGTVTDMLTGLVWLKDASCADIGSSGDGIADWPTALSAATGLADGDCGLTDGSVAGDWRLPSDNELHSLADFEYFNPALSNASGTAQWIEGDPFEGVQSTDYWSSTSLAGFASSARTHSLFNGGTGSGNKADSQYRYAWPVRGVWVPR